MDADALELIAADARERRVARRVEIIVEKRVGEIAHGQARGVDMVEQVSPSRTSASAECSSWVLPRKACKLLARGGAVGRLGKPPRRRAPASGRRRAPGGRACFAATALAFARASSARPRRRLGAPLRASIGALVDLRRARSRSGMPGGRQHLAPRTSLFEASTSG